MKLLGYIGELRAALGDALGLSNAADSVTSGTARRNKDFIGGDQMPGQTQPLPSNIMPGTELQPFTSELALDDKEFNLIKDAANTALDNLAKREVKAKIGADTTQLGTAATFANAVADLWEQKVVTADWKVDTTQVATAATFANQVGDLWDTAQFIADFKVNTSQVATAYTFASEVGANWDASVFTASFEVDTSGLDTAALKAAATAQYIRDIMPNSPAKKGPLSTPISFAYIADNLIDTMDTMRGAAEDGARDVVRSISRSASMGVGLDVGGSGSDRSSGGDTVIFDVDVQVDGTFADGESMQRAVIQVLEEDVVPALDLANRNRKRAWGLRP